MADHVNDYFEWDEEKSERCLRERNFDFEFASRIFGSELYYEEVDDRSYGGEERNKCVGMVGDVFLTVIYTIRNGRKRLISAWRSHKKEIQTYVETIGL